MRRGLAALALGGAAMFGAACDSEGTTGIVCPATTGIGDLVVPISIEQGVGADVLVTGPDGVQHTLTASDTLANLPVGAYTVVPRRVFAPGAIVGRAFSGVASPATICVEPAIDVEVTVTYAVEPGSEKLWVGDASLEALGYASELLETSGLPPASVAIADAGASPQGVAFDPDGHLWVADRAGFVRSYARDSLGSSGALEPRLTLSGDGVAGAHAIAFDAEGALWVANATTDRVSKIDPAQLVRSGTARPRVVLSGPDIVVPQGLAFDAAGNLWIASSRTSQIRMFTAARLARSTGGTADRAITGETAPPTVTTLLEPRGLAFDTAGNLWVGYLGQNALARYTPDELGVSGTKTPCVQITIDAIAMGESLAFDEAGSLWLPASNGQLAALTASQLPTSGHHAAAVLLDSPTMAGGAGLAFNPAPAGLPLQR